ncbi:hypothetical protein D3C75_933390 [compost metagenome]
MYPLDTLSHHADAKQHQPSVNHFTPQAALGFQRGVNDTFRAPFLFFLLHLWRCRIEFLGLLFVKFQACAQHRFLWRLQRLGKIDTRF